MATIKACGACHRSVSRLSTTYALSEMLATLYVQKTILDVAINYNEFCWTKSSIDVD